MEENKYFGEVEKTLQRINSKKLKPSDVLAYSNLDEFCEN